jgi:thioredoxin 1
MSVKIVTANNIEEIIAKEKIVFLDFWASWCAPCQTFGPIYHRVAESHPDLFFGKVNTEVEHLLSEDFDIRSIPTLIILKEGTIIFSESGVIPEYALKGIVEKARTINVETLENE